jgi:D-alanyl-D-alanine carboxypeptidase (penicillin-binding protein 5/6)
MLSIAVVFAASTASASAQWRRVHKTTHHSKQAARAATSGGPLYKGALLEDADSGRVLMAYNADMEWPPASMAKMMNLLVAQEQINAGRFSGNDMVRISERSAHTGGSRVGL